MAESLPLPPFPAALRGLPREELDRAIAVLRAELEATTDRGSRALLGRRLATAALERGDSASAARDDLAALHDAPGFVESVEALLGLALRSRSKTNREKLLGRLGEIATNGPTAERAALEAAATAFDEQRYADAVAIAERAIAQGVRSPPLALIREFASAGAGSPEEHERAVMARLDEAPGPRFGEALALRAFRLARAGATGATTSALRALCSERGWSNDALLEYEESFAALDGDVTRALEAARELLASTKGLTPSARAAARLRIVDYGVRVGRAETALDELDAALDSRDIAAPGRGEGDGGGYEQHAENQPPATLLELSLLTELGRALGQFDLAHGALDRAIQLAAREIGAPDASAEWVERLVRLETGVGLSGSAHPGVREALSSDDPVSLALALVECVQWDTQPPAQASDASAPTPLERLAKNLANAASRESTRGGGRAALYVSAFLLELRAASLGSQSAREGARKTLDRAFEAGLDPLDRAQLSLALAGTLGTPTEELDATLALLEQLDVPGPSPTEPTTPEGNGAAEAGRQELMNRAIRLAVTTHSGGSLDRLAAFAQAQPRGVATAAVALGLSLAAKTDEGGGNRSRQKEPLLTELARGTLGPLARRSLGLLVGHGSAPSELADQVPAPVGAPQTEQASSPPSQDALLFEAARSAFSLDRAALASGASDSTARRLSEAAGRFAALAELTQSPDLADGLTLRAALAFVTAGESARAANLLAARRSDGGDEPLDVARRWLERSMGASWAQTDADAGDLSDLERLGLSLVKAFGSESASAPAGFIDDELVRGTTPGANLLALLVQLHRGDDSLEERVTAFPQLDDRVAGALLFGARARRGDDLTAAANSWAARDDAPASLLARVVAARRTGDVREASVLEQALAGAAFSQGPDTLTLAWQRAEAAASSGDASAWPGALAELGQALGRSSDGDLTTLLAGVAELGRGNPSRALELLEPLEARLEDDPTLLACLGHCARATGQNELEARVTEQLARQATEPLDAARLWERVGELSELLGDTNRADAAFTSALGRNPASRIAFSRLYALAHASGDRSRLVDLLELRLDADPNSLHRAELLWTSARYQRDLGRRSGAERALSSLLEVDPTHLAGNALLAEFLLTSGEHERALGPIETVARHPDTPKDARLRAARAAIEIHERLGRAGDALGLSRHVGSLVGSVGYLGSRDWQRTEARLLARVGDFDGAGSALRQLVEGEDHIQTRLDDARLLLAIERDHNGDPARTLEAARHVLRDAPGDRDATDVVLSAELSTRDKRGLLAPELDSTLLALRSEPLDAARVRRLLALAAASDAAEYERVALGMLELIARLDDSQRARLDGLLRSGKAMPDAGVPLGALDVVIPNAQKGAFANFLTAAGPAISAATAPSLAALGVSADARIEPRAGSRQAETAAWAALVGTAEHELYVGGSDPERVLVVPGRVPQVLLGAAVPAPLDVQRRARLAALLFSARVGTLPLVAMPLEEASAWLHAAANLAPEATDGDAYEDHESRRAALARSLSGSDLVALEELAREITRSGSRIDDLAVAARTSALSVAALAAGTPSIVRQVRELLPTDDGVRKRVIADVLRFSISPEFFELRREAGLDT